MSVIEELKAKFSGAALPGSLCLELDGKAHYFDANGNEAEGASEADCTLILSEKTLEEIVAGEKDPMAAYFSGDLQIKGDMSVATELAGLLK